MTRTWVVVRDTAVQHVNFTLKKDSAGSSLHHAYEVQGEDFTVEVCIMARAAVFVMVNCSSLYYLTLESRGRQTQ
jgi:hypothetical protein